MDDITKSPALSVPAARPAELPAAPELPTELPTERSPVVIWPETAVVLWFGAISPFCSVVVGLLWPDSVYARTKYPFAEDALWSIQYNIGVSLMMVCLLWRSGESWSHWGIVRFSWRRDISIGIALWLSEWFLHDAIQIFLRRHFSGSDSEFGGAGPSRPIDYVLLGVMCALIGFAEEIIYRGYLIPRFERIFKSTEIAVVATSILFASVHTYYGATTFLGFVCFGVVYGTFFAWLRRLWPLAIAHALMDFYIYCRLPG